MTTAIREAAVTYETGRSLPEGKLTFEEFLAWCDEDTWAEWVDGEVIVLTPAKRKHQDIKGFLYSVIREFLHYKKTGRVFDAPFLVRLPGTLRRGREPDILYVSNEKLPLLKETYMDGPPDLIVEITSPESLARDRGEKYVEYEAAGVQEYWLIDPDRQEAEFYRLGENGRYRTIAPGGKGVYCTEILPGFWLKVDWLWQDPPPSVITCLKEMGIV
ncbi:Putative restriction endonuclease [Neomoorella glycerini]|uniref:Restriction endonuclease n=1 Tax=Neomoorella glycerini TaxID=55779 RepID=A0A6I5ZPZ8_9FIRM|nr:Uma2 family endonuclease [Moorella glycerini]QGP91900.1 Putative restriction endonuclease [Moorella glycerini]